MRPRRPAIAQGLARAEAQAEFCKAFVELGTVNAAAKAAGIAVDTHYDWVHTDPAYAERYEAAQEASIQYLEQEAIRRAAQGVDRGVYYRGVLVGSEKWYSDTLLMFLLKARRRSVYGDIQAITGADGGPLQVQAVRPDALSRLTAAQLDALAALNGIPVARLVPGPGEPGEPAGPVVDAEVALAEAPEAGEPFEPFDPAF